MTGPWEKYQSGPWEKYGPAEDADPIDIDPMEGVEAKTRVEPQSIVERLTGGYVNKPAFVAAGGMTGGALGVPAGPVGIAGGGGLGAAAGSYLYDLLEAKMRDYHGESRPDSLTGLGPTRSALNEAAFDVATAGAAPFIGPAVKRGIRGVVGVGGGAARRTADAAKRHGIPLGVQHIGGRKWVKGAPQVLGVFPFVGAPYRRGQEAVTEAVNTRANTLLNELAPTQKITDLGHDIMKSARGRYRAVNKIAGGMYKRFYDLADDLPENAKAILDTQPIKDYLGELGERAAKERITLQSGEDLAKMGDDPFGDFVGQLKDLPDRITVEQARGLERDLNAAFTTAQRQGFDLSRWGGVKSALEDAKGALDLSKIEPAAAERITDAWSRANAFFKGTRSLYESPTASRFKSVDKRVFSPGTHSIAGRLHDDEAFHVLNSNSVDAVKDLRQLIGGNRFNQVVRKHIEKAKDAAMIQAKEGGNIGDLFSAAKFEKALGLGTDAGDAVLKEMLRGSNLDVATFKEFVDVAKKSSDIVIRDPSTFLARRVVLGGGMLGAVALGAGKVSIPAAALITFAASKGAKGLMNPKTLQNLTHIMEPSTTQALKKKLLTNLLTGTLTPTEEREVPDAIWQHASP